MATGKHAANPKRPRSAARVATPARRPTPRRQRWSASPRARLVLAKGPAAISLLFSLWLLVSLVGGPRFQVQAVTVEGALLASEAEVRELVAVDGSSIFRVPVHRMARSIMEQYGFMEGVKVRCRMPSDVTIALKEHPIAFVWESDGQRWWVDSEGVLWGNAPASAEKVVIRDTQGYASEPEGQIVGVPWQLAEEMLLALPDIPEYEYTREAGLILYVTEKAWPVYLGHDGDAAKKAAVLRALAERLIADGVDVEYLDLRNEQRPTYKKRP